MGGEITWLCDGSGDYIFTLKIHRDCNGPPVGTSGQTIRVWGHPTVTQIPVNFSVKNEVSPICKEVPGGPQQISCTSNVTVGAVEEYVFQSAPITLTGVPPAQGWVFTWDNLTRNSAVTNLVSPSTKGITLRAIMYSNGGASGSPCYDSSPQFIESPSSIICAGNAFTYSPNAFDPDLDSLVFSFGQPLDNIQTSYSPPTDPAPLNYTTGYTINSPLPGTIQNSSNIPATINPSTGEINFTSYTLGSFAIVVKVQAYRCNTLIAEVYREMQVIIVSCGTNASPVVTPPLKGNTSFSDTVIAGQLVLFNFEAEDYDLLQDNSPQSVEITASGSQFGANFSDPNNGCNEPPCATLSFTPPVTGSPDAFVGFQWQTTCDHLVKNSGFGCGRSNTYQFVFKVKDDFCPAPALRYHTVSITVVPPTSLPPPDIKCVSVLNSGDIRISWEPITDTGAIFQSYEIYGRTGAGPFNLLGSLPTVNSNTFLHFGANGQNSKWEYLIATKSACDIENFADTVSSMYLNVGNPGNGEAVLQWNPIFSPTNSPTASNWYYIYKEFPTGVWTFVDSVPYGTNYYRDTITVCNDSINYRIIANNTGCSSLSSKDGDNFQDKLAPKPPVIRHVTVDTSLGINRICWYPTKPNDVEGYIILRQIGTTWQPVDTVWAADSLCYNDFASTPNFNAECYGVAAFDSCWTGSPATPNTSAMGTSHCSMFLNENYDVCGRYVSLNWTSYTDWTSSVSSYEIYQRVDNGPSTLAEIINGSTTNTIITNLLPNRSYCFTVRAISGNSKDTAISNQICFNTYYPNVSDTNYLQVATVETNSSIRVSIMSDQISPNIQGYQIERSLNGGTYSVVGFAPYAFPTSNFIDNNVSADQTSYYYRALAVDSCGSISDSITNSAKTILLTTSSNSNAFTNFLSWDYYFNWDGGTDYYEVWRKLGNSPYSLVGTVPFGTQQYQDDVSSFYNQNTQGSFCYKIKAVENTNSYGFNEESFSNESCSSIDYLLYIPNAFTPNGINPIFKPVIGYANFDSYEFIIYNRIYKEVFYSNNVDQGWDGTFQGKSLPEGVYVYFVQFNDAKGQPFQKVGHVTLLRD